MIGVIILFNKLAEFESNQEFLKVFGKDSKEYQSDQGFKDKSCVLLDDINYFAYYSFSRRIINN